MSAQDRSARDAAAIGEGVAIVQAALVRDRLGPYQAEAAVWLRCTRTHPSTAETD